MFNSVVFPDPLGPTKPANSPFPKVRLMLCRAVKSPVPKANAALFGKVNFDAPGKYILAPLVAVLYAEVGAKQLQGCAEGVPVKVIAKLLLELS